MILLCHYIFVTYKLYEIDSVYLEGSIPLLTILCDRSELLIVSKYLRLSVRLPVAPMIMYSNGSRDHNAVDTLLETDIIFEKLICSSLDHSSHIHVEVSQTSSYRFFCFIRLLVILLYYLE